jgi:hypothetical protein
MEVRAKATTSKYIHMAQLAHNQIVLEFSMVGMNEHGGLNASVF